MLTSSGMSDKRSFKFVIIFLIVVVLVVLVIDFSYKPSVFKSSYYSINVSSSYNNNKNNGSLGKDNNTYLNKVVLYKNYNLPFFSRPVETGDFSFIDTANYFQTYGVSNPNYQGSVVKIDNQNGKIVWQTDLPNLVMNTPLVLPEINKVIVGIGNDEFFKSHSKLIRGTGTSGIYALDIETGKILWKFPTVGQRKPTLVYKNNTIYSVGGNGVLYAISASNGKELWSYNYGSYTSQGSLTLVGDNLYFGGAHPYKLFDFNIKTRKITWSDDLGKSYGINGGLDDTTIAYGNGSLYTVATKLVNKKQNKGYDYLFKINAKNGDIVWNLNEGYGLINLPNGAQMEGTVPTITNNKVYIGSTTAQKIYAVNSNTGKIIWAKTASGLNNKPFVILNKFLYYDNGLGDIYVYNRFNGRYLAERTTGGQVAVSGLTYFDGRFFADTSNGHFFIFK